MADKGLVLVTGATGYVGKWTVIEALKAGYRVRGSLRSMSKAEAVRTTVRHWVGDEAAVRLELVELDLLDDKGWTEAMRGVDAVLHVATTVLAEEPRDPNVVVRPALEGTERVLRFADAAGIKRIVMTSSIATVGYGQDHTTGSRVYTEENFTNLDNMRFKWAYCIGKTKAEQMAWAFAREKGLELTTIHPGMILGPPADEDASVSVMAVAWLMTGKMPALPTNGFSLSDVREVAELHIAALESEGAKNQRYLATGEYLRFPELAAILKREYPNAKVTLRTVPDWVMFFMAFFGGPVRQIINDIGNEKIYDGSKAEALLGRKFRGARDVVVDTAEGLIALGQIQRP